MEKRFKLLGAFSVTFKVLSVGVLLLLGVALVKIAKSPPPKDIPEGTLLVTVLNTILSLSIISMLFYSVGEMIRILRAIEEQTRKS